MSLWEYPVRSERECPASGAPGRNCVDLRDRVGSQPSSDDLCCSYCGRPFDDTAAPAPLRIKRPGDDLDGIDAAGEHL
jgi:hypothetical protein